ncbi:flavin reductase family protein [Alicyclobacillus cycloheptanicus]|nr:flavin reductase family protein [Alicyclobacillus cycloheptanicus]
MELHPDQQSWTDNYKLLIGSIVPRPIAFVSTVNNAGDRNLAAFSFFNGVCPKPFIISFAPMRRADGSKKDTLRNIEETGEFVVNIVSEPIAAQMNVTSPTPEFPPEVDEWEVSGLTPTASVKVRPPRVLESPIHLECELVQVLDFGEAQAGAGSLVLGKVVLVHVREDVYHHGRIDPDVLRPVARMAGAEYARATDRFEMPRPRAEDWLRQHGQGDKP